MAVPPEELPASFRADVPCHAAGAAIRRPINGDALRNADAETAVALGDTAIAARPEDADAWYHAGQAYGWMAMEASVFRMATWADKAHEALRKAATLDPDHLGAREGLVQFYLIAPRLVGGGRDRAEAEVADYARRKPAGGHYLRAMLHKDGTARRELREAIRLAPTEAKFRSALIARLVADEVDAQALLAEIDAALGAIPDDARLLYQLGRFAALHGQRAQEGEAALGRVIDGSAEAADEASLEGAYWRRGQLREKRRAVEEALADYREAVRRAPGNKEFRKDLVRLEGRG